MEHRCRWDSPNCFTGPDATSLWEEPCVPRRVIVRVCQDHVVEALLKGFRRLDPDEASAAEVMLS